MRYVLTSPTLGVGGETSMYENQQTRRWCLRAIGGAVGGAAFAGSASADEHIVREEAVLTGEDHGIETDASGRAMLAVNVEEGTVAYQLQIDRICNPTMAHVHLGGPDVDGPVVTWLYPEDAQEPRPIDGLFQGTLAAGTITPDDYVGPLEGLSFEEAGAMLEEEGAYVNVHTEEHPGGEIRGQIEPVEEPPEDDDGDDEQQPDDDDGDDDTDAGDDGDDETDADDGDEGGDDGDDDGTPPGNGEDLDCEDFDTQQEAQEVYEEDPSDPHDLDRDDDGEACEDLPGGSSSSSLDWPFSFLRSLFR